MVKWPMDRNMPDPPRKASYANDPHWIRSAWVEATGRTSPTRVEGPFLPPDEAGRVMMALGRKTLDVHLRSCRW